MHAQRPAHSMPVPGATAAAGRGQLLRQLVAKALNCRRMATVRGASHVPEHILAPCRMRLEQWLRVNPHPGTATVRAFGLAADVARVMPANAGGRKLLNELHQLLT